MLPPELPRAIEPNSAAPQGGTPPPARSIVLSVLACLAMAVGACAIPVSLFAALMIAGGPSSQSSDPLGFMLVVLGPAAVFVAGLGLLRRWRFAYFLALGLLCVFMISCVVDLASQPLEATQKEFIAPSGVPTTLLSSGSQRSIAPLLLSLGVLGYLLLPSVRAEFWRAGRA